MSTATLNVRMPQELKTEGDKVFLREGVSVSQAIRGLYEYVERTQELPAFLKGEQGDDRKELFRKRREALESLRNILPADIDLDEVKAERLARQTRSGVLL